MWPNWISETTNLGSWMQQFLTMSKSYTVNGIGWSPSKSVDIFSKRCTLPQMVSAFSGQLWWCHLTSGFHTWFSPGCLRSAVGMVGRLLTWPLDKRVSRVPCPATADSELRCAFQITLGYCFGGFKTVKMLEFGLKLLPVSAGRALEVVSSSGCINVLLYQSK